jgi:HEAT repeat protein
MGRALYVREVFRMSLRRCCHCRAAALVAPLFALAGAGCQHARHLYQDATGNTAIVAAARMENPTAADERRHGINYLVDRDFGRRDPYTERYEQIARGDKDAIVRATALRALNRARDASATPVFVGGLGDDSEFVRLEAAKALANIPDPAAAPALIRVLTRMDEARDVRIAAADALRHYRTLEVARVLVTQLSGRDFGVAWQARQSLKHMTGQRDLRYDEAGWLAYLTGPAKPFG